MNGTRLIAAIALVAPTMAAAAGELKAIRNSLGMDLVEVPAGSFRMGSVEGLWDQQPVHRATISQPLRMSAAEVTVDQYRAFRPGADVVTGPAGAACGVSWQDATAFCRWLSEKEGKPYRLPTEAEWEYACRAGTTTPYWSGEKRPALGRTNPWGLRNMHTGAREWCLDWYGDYPGEDQADPVGPAEGLARVVRGGGLDTDDARYATSASRAGIAPAFGIPPVPAAPADAAQAPQRDVPERSASGRGGIGFRVVQAPLPRTPPLHRRPFFVQLGVKPTDPAAKVGPDPARPYFRRRYLLPTPPETGGGEGYQATIDAAGLHPSFRGHNHSPALEVCPNGDVLMVIYTSYHEYEPEVSLISSRLRLGADRWDFPSRLVDFPGVNDHAPLLWADGGVLRLFWGNPKLAGGFPFQWIESRDDGATWGEVRFPGFGGPIGPHSRQPINTAFRGPDGTMYVASDGAGGTSVLWASRDDGATWYDTGGRSGGRHTTYVPLKDGSILGMGGKNTSIDGYMPQSVSTDGGKSWKVSRTPFSALGSNQRPSVLRLASGRLFFASDFQHRSGRKPDTIRQSGAAVALSDDDGRTWHIRKLPGAQPHESDRKAATLGYSAARQAPNGVIHLITTMNRPCLHFEMNEAWVLSDADGDAPDAALMAPTARSIADVRQYDQKGADGRSRITWSAGRGDDGRYLLDGTETWYDPAGRKQYQATYRLGRKVGTETLWRPDGGIEWQWDHRDDGTSVWTQWWPNGRRKAESTWRDFHCTGPARLWARDGKIISEKQRKLP